MSVVDGGDHLVASELRAELGNCRIGSEIVVVEETRSTNDLVWAAADRGTPEGFVVFAERQTAGRGQYGRRWESAPHQGIAMSVLLRPAITLRESPRLTSLLAEVIAAVITDETGCAAAIKPPNDIYRRHGRRPNRRRWTLPGRRRNRDQREPNARRFSRALTEERGLARDGHGPKDCAQLAGGCTSQKTRRAHRDDELRLSRTRVVPGHVRWEGLLSGKLRHPDVGCRD